MADTSIYVEHSYKGKFFDVHSALWTQIQEDILSGFREEDEKHNTVLEHTPVKERAHSLTLDFGLGDFGGIFQKTQSLLTITLHSLIFLKSQKPQAWNLAPLLPGLVLLSKPVSPSHQPVSPPIIRPKKSPSCRQSLRLFLWNALKRRTLGKCYFIIDIIIIDKGFFMPLAFMVTIDQ